MRNPDRKIDELYRDDFNTKCKAFSWLVFESSILQCKRTHSRSQEIQSQILWKRWQDKETTRDADKHIEQRMFTLPSAPL